MLLGTHEHTVDDKNRVTLPAKFRRAFEAGVVVTRGLDPCLVAYPTAEWERAFGSRLEELDELNAESRQLRRYFYANAVECELDKQGRFVVPGTLKDYAGFGRDVVVAGVHDHLEIWDRGAWQRVLSEAEGSVEHVAERLAAKRN